MEEPKNEPKNTNGSESGSNNNEKIEEIFANYVQVIFKKASKICTLYDDAKLAIFLFSPNGTAYSFGHPSVDVAVNNYLDDASTDDVNHAEEARRIEMQRELNIELSNLKELLKKEKERGARLNALEGGDGTIADVGPYDGTKNGNI